MKSRKLLPWLLTLAVSCSSHMLLAQTVYDDSDGPFSILAYTVAVTSPNGGEEWSVGETYNITWSLDSSVTNVNIDYSIDNGSNWVFIAANATNNGQYAWAVPDSTSTSCLVRVSYAINSNVYDVSDAVFSIIAAETITAPTKPSGPTDCLGNTIYTFSTGGSTSGAGHDVQYKLDWDDGSDSGWLPVGTTSADHAWTSGGTYNVRAKARCATHTNAESPWSESLYVSIPQGNPQLLWNTFMGNVAWANAVATDSSGNIYLTGNCNSTWGNPLRPHSGGDEAFVAKLDASGNLLWHTFLGSQYGDSGNGIAIDSSGNIYVIGSSKGTWGSPLRAYTGDPGYTNDTYVAKLNTDGTLLWNTFLGSGWNDYGDEVVIGSNGDIFVAGSSERTWGTPKNPFVSPYSNGFLVRMSANGALQWLTFFGGGGDSSIEGIAVDSSGSLFLMGYSTATWGSPLNPHTSGIDFYIVKFHDDGAREWNTFSGGGTYVKGGNGDIALDSSGNIYVIGGSSSTWGNPLNPFGGGTSDALVAKFNASGALQWHTFLGGSNSDSGYGIILAGDANIYVTGFSRATWGNPLNPFPGGISSFVAKLNLNGALLWNTFMGINCDPADIARDKNGNLLVVGQSNSTWGNPINPFTGSSANAFAAKLGFAAEGLSVTAPDGGENWSVGSSQNITWSSPGSIANVNIDYSTDSGDNWIAVAAGIPNNGSYSWTVPNTPSTTCLVRVSDSANSSVFDVSNATFSITINSTITVTSPNGGEQWVAGSAHNITWSSSGSIDNVNIDYSTNNGNNWTAVATSVANTGSYSWTVPATPSTSCLVRVSNASDASVFDISDAVFSISAVMSITVIAPNGGENWAAGSSQSISWSSSGSIANVNIDYSTNNGTNWTSVASNITNSSSYSWTVPATPSTSCLVRVSNAAGGNPSDCSNAVFTISSASPFVTVTSPNGGERWQRGTAHAITWNSGGIANIKIELWKGTKRNATLASSVSAASGSYNWTISSSQTVGSDYKIRLTSTANSALTDSSDANFAIFAPSITITAPATGAKWKRGVTHTITWTWEGTMNANVKIQLIKGTSVSATLATSTANDGIFDWAIPANQALATNYKIRIITVDNLITGNSGTFSIVANSSLTILNPNNGEALPSPMIYPIRWTVDPAVRAVNLEYSLDNGGAFFQIAADVPNSGYYEWQVPAFFTSNGIVRVMASRGKNWRLENGVLETVFKFSCHGPGETERPEIIVWHGSPNVAAPGYGFAKVGIGRKVVQMEDILQVIEPLSSGWHEAKIRLDLKRDLGTLFIDGKPLLENVFLNTSNSHYFEPYLAIQCGDNAPADLMLSGLTEQVTLLDGDGNETDSFTLMNEDFSGYDEEQNGIGYCWQIHGFVPDETKLDFKPLSESSQILHVRTASGMPLTLGKPLALPEKVPFDISDRRFIIKVGKITD